MDLGRLVCGGWAAVETVNIVYSPTHQLETTAPNQRIATTEVGSITSVESHRKLRRRWLASDPPLNGDRSVPCGCRLASSVRALPLLQQSRPAVARMMEV